VQKCEQARQRAGIRNIEFAVDDLTRIDDRQAWDFIYSIDVVEHIADNRALMSRFYSALRPGGYLYIRIPSCEQDRIFPRSWVQSHEQWAEHEHVGQHFDLEGLVHCLTGCGFSIVYAARTNGFFGKIAFELGHVLDERSTIAYALSVPGLKALYWLDLLTGPKRRGNGIVVMAQRPPSQ
jgi:SAM-dependent methyltransferase